MIHFVYRATHATNRKNRPGFFDKSVALASFLRARERVRGDAEILFLLDGPFPAEGAARLERVGEVERHPGRGNGGSYRRALELPAERRWPDGDLVYLAEDDYLYVPEAFERLEDAARGIPEAAYFTLYDHPDRYRRDDDADGGRSRVFLAGGRHWRSVESTCLSFAARTGALRRDLWIHRLGSRGEIPEDRTIWRAVQGLGRFFWRRPRRVLVSPLPSLATHLETEHLAPGVDWEAVAASAREWGEAKGILPAFAPEPVPSGA